MTLPTAGLTHRTQAAQGSKERDRTRCSQFRVCPVEAISNFGDGVVIVIGQTIDDDRAAAATESFVADSHKVFTAHTFGFFDRLFNDVTRHLIAFRSFHQVPQSWIVFGVRYA